MNRYRIRWQDGNTTMRDTFREAHDCIHSTGCPVPVTADGKLPDGSYPGTRFYRNAADMQADTDGTKWYAVVDRP